METPIPAIMLALDGKVDFLRKTSPYGGGEDKKQQSADEMAAVLRAARPKGQ